MKCFIIQFIIFRTMFMYKITFNILSNVVVNPSNKTIFIFHVDNSPCIILLKKKKKEILFIF